ncbi:hypothetical protein BIFADO_01421, partial [Bifidobacterium adolescentis L2-32]
MRLRYFGAGHQQFLDLAEAAHHQAAVVVELGAHAQATSTPSLMMSTRLVARPA